MQFSDEIKTTEIIQTIHPKNNIVQIPKTRKLQDFVIRAEHGVCTEMAVSVGKIVTA